MTCILSANLDETFIFTVPCLNEQLNKAKLQNLVDKENWPTKEIKKLSSCVLAQSYSKSRICGFCLVYVFNGAFKEILRENQFIFFPPKR